MSAYPSGRIVPNRYVRYVGGEVAQRPRAMHTALTWTTLIRRRCI